MSSSAIDDIVRQHALPRWRMIAWVLMLLLAAAVFWAASAQLDEVSIASGEVIPQGKVKTVQHFEGGFISELLVQEGMPVAAGQTLLQLDLSLPGANQEDLQVRLDALLIARVRLKAEADGAVGLEFPPELAERRPDLVDAERRTWRARVDQLRNSLDTLRTQVRQRDAELRQLRDRQRVLGNDLRTARERFRLSKELIEKALMSKLDHLAMQREVELLEGELSSVGLQIPRAEAALEETQHRLKEQEIRFGREAIEEFNKNEPQIARTREMLAVSVDQVRRTRIASPIEGVVKDLRYNTIGGVVKPGEPIMTIVPTQANLVVESKLLPADRGYVRVGQDALVKITAYDFYRYGGLNGRVTGISADSVLNPDSTAYFRVTVETDRTHLGTAIDQLAITPGMQASVEIRTGERTVLEFLLKPLLRIRFEGFRER